MSEDAMNERLMQVYKELKKIGLITTKTAFMESIGQSKQHFTGFEDGTRKVHPKHITLLSNQFGVNADYLLSGALPILKGERQEAGGSYSIKGNKNTGLIQGGTGNQISSGGGDCEQQLAIALERIAGLEREVELYKEMITLLKK